MHKFLIVLVLAAAVLGAPQVAVEGEAELVPGGAVRRPSGGGVGGDSPVDGDGFRFFLVPRFSIRNIFRDIFGGGEDSPSFFGGGPSFLPDFFGQSPNSNDTDGGFFDIPDNLPGNYENTTREVIMVNGVPREVNRTIIRTTNEDGSVSTSIIRTVISIPSGADGEGGDAQQPTGAEDASENELFGEAVGLSGLRSRRWVSNWLRNILKRPTEARDSPAAPRQNTLHDPRDKYAVEGGEGEDYVEIIPIRNDEDIAINYLAPLPFNPDAEVFDPELLKEDERRFFEGRTEPIRSQPMMSQPLRAQPMMSQPLRAQPMMSQPLRAQPMMSQPLRAQPMRSQPIRAQPEGSHPSRTRFVRF